MHAKQIILSIALACNACATTSMNTPLTTQEQSIAALGASTAQGDQTALRQALEQGLDAGLSLAELKDLLIQLYAYCGFPRSLNALDTLMKTAQERLNAGKKDTQGNDSPALQADSLKQGTENQTRLCGAPVRCALFSFAPAIDQYLKAHLFGDIFSNPVNTWQTRELATISALAAMKGTESQLNSHILIGKRNGLAEEKIQAALDIARNIRHDDDFPMGQANTAYQQYFSGQSWVASLSNNPELGVPIANVTFEPSCRNNWHSHTGGQILIATSGTGYYQEKGKPARRLQAGDVVEIAPHTIHWHGAAPDSWFSHLAIECHPETNKNTWLEPVTDQEYQAVTQQP